MKKNKMLISALSIGMLFSFAFTAIAAPTPGIYANGHQYSLTLSKTSAAYTTFQNDFGVLGDLSKIFIVDANAKYTTLSDVATSNAVNFSGNAASLIGNLIPQLVVPVANNGTVGAAVYADPATTPEQPPVTQGVAFDISVSKVELASDSADNANITITAKKDGVVYTDFNGTVKFTSDKGATFAKNDVAFDAGVATTTVNSISSATLVVDVITAKVMNTGDVTFDGMEKKINITYKPSETPVDTGQKAVVTYAQANNASEVTVKFNRDVNFNDLYADSEAYKILYVYSNAMDRTYYPKDIVKIDSKTVKLIFDQEEALPDNTTLQAVGEYSGTTGTLLDESAEFQLVDSTPPAAVEAIATDYRTILVKFTEAIANTGDWAWVLNGKLLTDSDIKKIYVGKDGKDYIPSSTAPKDYRNYVTIELTSLGVAKLRQVGYDNVIQASNIIDYAGLSDVTGQNKATTQDFMFTTPVPPAAPTATVVMDSPEQFRVLFSSNVEKKDTSDPLDSANFKMEYQAGVDESNNPIFVEIPLVNEDDGNVNAIVTEVASDEYLFELNRDWTDTLLLDTQGTTHNYYTPKYNKVKMTVLSADIENDAAIAMVADKVDIKTMTPDNTSPTVADAKQIINDGTYMQAVKVNMAEPVQMFTGSEGDTNPITPSQTQAANTGVPTPTFQFVSEDLTKTIDGVLSESINATDTEFVVVPASDLAAGNWTLYIKSISDDIGNTSATVSAKLEIKTGVVPVAGSPRIIWADAHDDGGVENADVIHIQFGTNMSMKALLSTIYTINGNNLPAGAKVEAVDDENYGYGAGTLVTITLPATTITQDSPNMLNVNKLLTGATGAAFEGVNQIQLPYGEGHLPS